jgi:hypothetical protein
MTEELPPGESSPPIYVSDFDESPSQPKYNQ